MPTAAPRRRILVSSFACSPIVGSEPGVGWRWSTELGRNFDVTVVTHGYYRKEIEAALAARPMPHVRFEWFTVPGVGGHPHRQLNSRLYYWLWQLTVRRKVRGLLASGRHDLVHHLTWGTYRFPSFLGGLGVPLVMGPVGGGEGAPARLYRSWPWREKAFYRLRELSIAVSRWDPFVLWTMSHAACILTKTRETRNALPWFARRRAVEASEIGVGPLPPAAPRVASPDEPLRLLYAGRLIGGKGLPYVLLALQVLARRGIRAQLTVAGNGRLRGWVHAQVMQRGLADRVSLLDEVPRERMASLYEASDVLAFPSWHDSSGNVVTEALSRGVPVVCLDIGGPRYAVDERCAVIVATQGLDETGLAEAFADGLERLHRDRALVARLSGGALARAAEMTWSHQVDHAYRLIAGRLGWSSPAPAPTTLETQPT